MRLVKARVQNYRSIIDTGEFDVEKLKTILVGPNEAGKTVLLKALQQLNRPDDVSGFDALRDYPRSLYNDITTGKVDPDETDVVTGFFDLEENDKDLIPENYHNCKLSVTRKLNNESSFKIVDGPERKTLKDIKNDLKRMAIHMEKQAALPEGQVGPQAALEKITSSLTDYYYISGVTGNKFKKWLEDNLEFVDEDNEKEENRYNNLIEVVESGEQYQEVFKILKERVPIFILFNNYFKVKPSIHLEHLSQRVDQDILDDDSFDYGNLCLLKLLGFTARELADLGNAQSPSVNNPDAMKLYKDSLDKRKYQLNAASVKLTREIRAVWFPNPDRPEADKLRVTADGQYLKVVVEDDLGVEIELDQRSEGFQWLVSFFVVFFSETIDKHENAVLLLDEPGMSLHALKQRDFRETISRLSSNNQTLFTTHSPFLVGPDELDIVRVVEMKNRSEGTKVHTTISSEDPAGILPLQEALGYDLANSLFSQQRNLILEGITDYWYIEATSELLRVSKAANLNEKIALVFANTAGKVVYYATILHSHNLKVAALLDSDAAGDQAAQQENLVHALGNKKILRTKDFCKTPKAEIEDLLRHTLIKIVNEEYGVDTSEIAAKQSNRPITDIFSKEVKDFSKYRLAKAYVKWTRENDAKSLLASEKKQWQSLIEHINKALK